MLWIPIHFLHSLFLIALAETLNPQYDWDQGKNKNSPGKTNQPKDMKTSCSISDVWFLVLVAEGG